jgi:TetR/AcrR family transcriptional repressor of nem operon
VKPTSKTEKTRQYIIETTAGIFNEKGYAGTSLSDLTKATKLTKGSIYGNFENKEEVALAAFDYNWKHVRKTIGDMMLACDSAKDRILVYCRVYSSNQEFFMKGGCPLLNTAVEADDTHEVLRERVAAAFMLWKRELVHIINEGVEKGEFRDDAQADKVALSVIALVEGSILIGKATKKGRFSDLILDSIKDLISLIEVKEGK